MNSLEAVSIKLFLFWLSCLCLNAQPALPVMTRQVVWIQPNTNNVSGYQLKWGTNILNVSGVSNTAVTIKLDEGINTLVLRASGVGTNMSDAITNITRLINYEFEESTNAGISWITRTNFTYAISNYKTSALFRAKLNWLSP